MTTAVTYTVTMDANLAKVVGVPAAMLYNLIAWLSDTDLAKEYDKDGWVYMTAAYFMDHTSFNADTFTRAAKKLEDEGLVERCRMYKKGTSISLTHFRLKPQNNDSQIVFDADPTRVKHELYNKKINKEDKSRNRENHDFSDAQPSASGASQTASARPAPTEDSLFGGEVREVSVRKLPNERAQKNRQAFAVLKEIREARGLKGNGGLIEKQRVAALLADGWTKEQLIDILDWCDRDEFYTDKPLATRLCHDAIEKYQAAKNNKIKMAEEGTNFEPLTWE